MASYDRTSLRTEVIYVRDTECLPTLGRLRSLVAAQSADPELARLMAVPLLYSVWERSFSIWTSICLKVVQGEYLTAQNCPPQTRAFWLRKADFFKSFVASVRDVLELEREDSILHQSAGHSKKITKGAFALSQQVLSKLDDWHANPLPGRSNLAELVVTYSNVNDAVVATNAEALGLSKLPTYASLDLSKLGQLVGMRNAIGHGGSLTAPGKRELDELIDYAEQLIRQYAAITLEWIESHDPGPEEAHDWLW